MVIELIDDYFDKALDDGISAHHGHCENLDDKCVVCYLDRGQYGNYFKYIQE